MRKLLLSSIAVLFVVSSLGCGGGGGGDSKIVHSKEDRLKYMAQMEAAEKGLATDMQAKPAAEAPSK
jgi:hypothetical protein